MVTFIFMIVSSSPSVLTITCVRPCTEVSDPGINAAGLICRHTGDLRTTCRSWARTWQAPFGMTQETAAGAEAATRAACTLSARTCAPLR